MPRTSTIIDIADTVKTYATNQGDVHALSKTSLSIDDGAFVSIVGPSGCGKTTLLKMIGGLIPPTEGKILIRGKEVLRPSEDVSFVFQNAVLLPWQTALNNILMPIKVHRRIRAEDVARAKALLDLVGLVGFADNYPYELSGGMQQRVSICRALVQDPSCLLLDEPFGALDALTRENMNVFFNGLWLRNKKTMVMVTHSIQEAVFLSTRVIVMSQRPGQIIDDVEIPFAAERSPEILTSVEFGAIAARIRKHFANTSLD